MSRVLLVSEAGAVGGAEVYLERLAVGMSRWHSRIVLPEHPALTAWNRRLVEQGLDVEMVPPGMSGWSRLRTLARDADLVHLNLPNTYDGHSGALAWYLARSGRPVVVTEHLTRLPRSRRRHWLKHRTDSAVTRRIVVSSASERDLIDAGFHRVDLVPNGVPDPGTPLPLPAAPSIAVAASLEERKRLDVLIDAAAGVPEVTVSLAGEGPLHAALTQRAKDRGVADRVTLVGRVEDPYAFFAAHRVAALPSRLEAMPLSLLEAMAAGRGMLVSDLPGLEDLVEAGGTGLRLPVGDVAAWTDAMAQLVAQPEVAAGWGLAARARYQQRFTLAACVAATESIYDRAVGP